MYLENQESVREKSVKSQGKTLFKVCGNPDEDLKTWNMKNWQKVMEFWEVMEYYQFRPQV